MTRAKRLRAFCFLLFFLNMESVYAQTVAELKAMPGAFKVRSSGLGVRVQDRGFGPFAKQGDRVEYHVECVDNDGNVLFSTTDRRAPQLLQYIPEKLTPALAEGLGYCRNGSRLILRAPSRLTPARISGPHSDTLYYYLSIVSLNGEQLTPEEMALARMEMFVYPNPAARNAFIQIEGAEAADLRLTIYDEKGALIVSRLAKTGSNEINIAEWLPGVYYIEVLARGLTIRHKLVKTEVD